MSALERALDTLMWAQRPVVLAHIRSIRARRPDAGPAQVVAMLERRYLAAVTTGGAAVGASAAIPAVGVGTSLALSGAETAGFLEATAVFAQSVAEVHGFPVEDPERARTLVMTLLLGSGGTELLARFAGQAAGSGPSRNVFWGETITKSLPRASVGPLADYLQKAFVKRFAVTQGGSVIGRMAPFGIGAVIGGTGNHLLGRAVVRASRGAFPPVPDTFPATLDPKPKTPKVPREPGARRLPGIPRPALPNLPRPRLALPARKPRPEPPNRPEE